MENNENISMIERKARIVAELAHAGQVRKYTFEPYIIHPEAVAEIVRTIPHTDEMLAASWLHDAVEDTSVALADIEKEFGSVVAQLVDDLTDKSMKMDGNRKTRKAIDLKHTASISSDAKSIKLADILDNVKSIIADERFSKVYLPEKLELLEVLKGGNVELWERAYKFITNHFERINSNS